MSILRPDVQSLIAQAWAARDAECAQMNIERMEAWRGRYMWNPVDVPARTAPAIWPVIRCSIPAVENVTPIRKRKGA